ncbi:excalibur calcium-binding domain-containing protein [Sphingobium sp. HBC34]|uniref:Excalibur calcium-binding domain-containing protein n=1 Tax=Sphingobium cyanobacteriorum TaxID=3063954 RepID=A0ABT8ZR01_9SPHN|nr:excalibur calcium-binding domain-containing protein [Sphingobium sp. HBC34]MDO7836972.1 excalibur calcium-binding domain-containing protein [Sphingobium sp. HBC34]
MRKFVFCLGFLVALLPEALTAHPGGLNSEGCHNNRKTGDYHCHRQASAPPTPRQSLMGSGGRHAFANCTAARAAGAAPVRVGDPGYGRHLDRDGDGVGCE